MRGNITRRGRTSWRLKFDAGRDLATGKRLVRFVTVKGKRQDAEKELTRLLSAAENGSLVEPSKITIREMLHSWLATATELSPKTKEGYVRIAEHYIYPHLGDIPIQKLRPAQVQEWHGILLKSGGKGGKPLAARSVGHCHRLLHRALERALKVESVARNVASAISPPKVDAGEVECLSAGQMSQVLTALADHWLHPIVALALATGMRRGELLALRWSDVDLDRAALRVERNLEETKAGKRFKAPKTRSGRRSISLPTSTVEMLRVHWRKQAELRLALGQGRADSDALVFATHEGLPLTGETVSTAWARAIKTHKLPDVMFHALRHSHASALIAAGLDIVTVSKRLGHGNPTITLGVYAHLFTSTDTVAAKIIEEALRL